MKHLNANLDNVTNVELKEAATGSIRFLGVDGSGDIVEATLPPNSGGGSVTFFANNNEIQETDGYYFEAPAGSYTSDCWRVGSTVRLTSTYANSGLPFTSFKAVGNVPSVHPVNVGSGICVSTVY